MVHAGEGHVDELELVAGGNDFVRHGHIGDDHGVGVLRLVDQSGDIGGLGVVDKFHFALKGLFEGGQLLRGDTERLEKNDFFHVFVSFLVWIISYLRDRTRWIFSSMAFWLRA